MTAKVVGCFLACIRSIPVVFITAIILWSYYAYVVQLCLFTIDSVVEKVFYLLFYHPIVILMSWSYWQSVFTPVAATPIEFYLSAVELEQLQQTVDRANRKEILDQIAKRLPLQCRLMSGDVRYCDRCQAIKPDRAHHCSICGRCVLKMDHHCPWVNNCVCFSNYKFFLLFLGYSLLYCLYVASTTLQYFIQFFSHVNRENSGMQGLHIVFLLIASVLFTVCLITLFGYHCYLVAFNKSTVESYQVPVFTSGPDKNGYNIGCYNNFVEVFGHRKWLWLLPVYTSVGDGVSYPSNNYPSVPHYDSMDTTTAISISETVQGTPGGGAIGGTVRSVRSDDADSLLGQHQQFWSEDFDSSAGSFMNSNNVNNS